MSVTADRIHGTRRYWVHPLHAVFLAGAIPLFLGAVLSDIAYAMSYQIQWTNFASWLIVGGLVFGGLAVLCAIIDLVRASHRGSRPLVYIVLLLATWILGLVNAFIHGKDAWASMPAGLVLSVIVALLACAATWLGFSSLRAGGV